MQKLKILAVAALMTVGVTAQASRGVDAKAAKAKVEASRMHFEEARKEYGTGKYDAAMKAAAKALDLKPEVIDNVIKFEREFFADAQGNVPANRQISAELLVYDGLLSSTMRSTVEKSTFEGESSIADSLREVVETKAILKKNTDRSEEQAQLVEIAGEMVQPILKAFEQRTTKSSEEAQKEKADLALALRFVSHYTKTMIETNAVDSIPQMLVFVNALSREINNGNIGGAYRTAATESIDAKYPSLKTENPDKRTEMIEALEKSVRERCA